MVSKAVCGSLVTVASKLKVGKGCPTVFMIFPLMLMLITRHTLRRTFSLLKSIVFIIMIDTIYNNFFGWLL